MDEKSESTDLKDIEKLFKENYKRLCNVVYRIINDWDAAEDVVQEMFVKIWKKRDELKVESTARGYLYRSASNAALNYLENNRRFRLNEEISEKNTSALIIDENSRLEERELQAKIDEALDRLPPKCKTIFILSRFEGMKYQEIADHLNLSLKTVENQMGIALKKLREDLSSYISTEYLFWPILLSLLAQNLF